MAILSLVIIGQILLVSAEEKNEITIPFVSAEEENEITITFGAYSPLCEKRGDCYVPSFLIIEQGSTVVWTNMDYSLHTVTSGNLWSGHNRLFGSMLLEKYDKFEFTFEDFEPAAYTYYCIMHPWMKGSIIVTGLPSVAPDAFP